MIRLARALLSLPIADPEAQAEVACLALALCWLAEMLTRLANVRNQHLERKGK